MADDVIATYEETKLNEAIGQGSIYTVLGVVVAVGLVIALAIGLSSTATIGVLTQDQAFMVGGLALVVICAATLVLLFSLTGTIRYINREMADLTRLRESITTSYTRLAQGADTLGEQLGELRQALPAVRKVLQEAQKAPRKR